MKYSDFKNEVLGKSYDFDGYYGTQCWDGLAVYASRLGQKIPNCTTTGYVIDIWNNRKTNGILNWCDEVTVMKAGDIAVFKKGSSSCPYSHIAIFDSDIDGKKGRFLGQNQQARNAGFTVVELPYADTCDTAFRPRCLEAESTATTSTAAAATQSEEILNSIPSDFHYESATYYPSCTIKIRKAPSLKGVDTGLCYKSGMSVNYDGYVHREGYCWVSWISASTGERRWMACGKSNGIVNYEPWGVFK